MLSMLLKAKVRQTHAEPTNCSLTIMETVGLEQLESKRWLKCVALIRATRVHRAFQHVRACLSRRSCGQSCPVVRKAMRRCRAGKSPSLQKVGWID